MYTNYMKMQGIALADLTYKGKEWRHAKYDLDYRWKQQWLKTGYSVLRAMADELGFDIYNVNKNPAGVAVTGETTLLGLWLSDPLDAGRKQFVDGIYLDTSSPVFGMYHGYDGWPQFMWRTVQRKDRTDTPTKKRLYSFVHQGVNQWTSYKMFKDLDALTELLLKAVRVPVL